MTFKKKLNHEKILVVQLWIHSSVVSPQVLRFELSWKGGERFKIWKDKKKIKKKKKDEKDIDWFLNSNFKNKINYQWKK